MATTHANPTPLADAASYDAAEAICRRHAKSFHFASKFLSKPKRRHAFAVYAFCRSVDDAVDSVGADDAKREKLAEFDGILDEVYAGRMPSALRGEQRWALEAFGHTVQACGIERALFDDLLTGVRMDLEQTRFADWQALEKYCYHVAGVVGLMMCRVFGLADKTAEPNAIAMGNAMQLTNILRDVGEDWQRGRLYIPQDELERFGVMEKDIAAGRVTRPWTELMQYQIARAERFYREGASGIEKLPNDGPRRTAAVMAVVYGGILDKIEQNGFDVFSQRAALSLPEKIARVPMAKRLWSRRPFEPVPQMFKLVTRGMEP
ncbi:MAG: phytoene/squalene synthase family protein [Planctomycetota bacterium]